MYKESVLSELCSVSRAERRAFEELHPPFVQAIPQDEVLRVAAKARRSTDRHLRLHIQNPDVLRRTAVGVDSDVLDLTAGESGKDRRRGAAEVGSNGDPNRSSRGVLDGNVPESVVPDDLVRQIRRMGCSLGLIVVPGDVVVRER